MATMRIDKMIAQAGLASRSEAAKAAKRGGVTVNGEPVRDLARHVDPFSDRVTFNGEPVPAPGHLYLMLNKPEGYVCSTDDISSPTVLTLLPEELQSRGLFPCGRLDKYTLGFVLLTTDGGAAHRMLSPKKHVDKVYRFTLEKPLDPKAKERWEQGVDIGGYVTAPCRLAMTGEREGEITLTEGKYHEIRRMAEALGNKILFLERIAFAGIALDETLPRGAWRPLTLEELSLIAPYLEGGQSAKNEKN